MAQSPSVLKRQRQTITRRLRNRAILSTMKTLIKHLTTVIEARKMDEARPALAAVTKALDKAVTKGVLHRNNASRRISRLARQVNGLQTAKPA